MTDQYAIFGNPVGHSKSPIIHAAFARQTGQDICYKAILAPLDGFNDAVHAFVAAGGRGANVTVPFKQEACALVTRLTPRAELAGAANTLLFEGNEVIGDNTDGVGLLRDITLNLRYPIKGKRVLLLGAGGASRGVVGPLLEEGLKSLTIANRTVSKAKVISEHFAHLGPVTACGYDELAGRSFDIVINATSASLYASMPLLPDGIFAPGSLAYEMMYGQGDGPFRIFAKNQGASLISEGLGMLVEQAAESFFIWRGVRPEGFPVMALLQKA
ncbi:shikimate dehydrogenase [Propionivibrio sp.]|uniref:shikimate dehydrogenase n=1 Tax=Propionivibrio sp. TaxID=2212460 RepID=UPI00261EEAB2|nr:shikimate dehydrogenase [Propionivibrio sp.]